MAAAVHVVGIVVPCFTIGLTQRVEGCKEVRVKIFVSLLVLSLSMASACASTGKVFPSKVMEGVDRHFDFSRWRMMTDGAESKKVQLGGRIRAVAGIRRHSYSSSLVSCPSSTTRLTDQRITGRTTENLSSSIREQIEDRISNRGNRVMVVGMTRPPKVVTVDDFSRSFPIVEAQCLHFWNTQGRDIEDFPFYEAGYVTLRQETVCAKNP